MLERSSEQLAGASVHEAGGYKGRKRGSDKTVTQYKHCDGT